MCIRDSVYVSRRFGRSFGERADVYVRAVYVPVSYTHLYLQKGYIPFEITDSENSSEANRILSDILYDENYHIADMSCSGLYDIQSFLEDIIKHEAVSKIIVSIDLAPVSYTHLKERAEAQINEKRAELEKLREKYKKTIVRSNASQRRILKAFPNLSNGCLLYTSRCV